MSAATDQLTEAHRLAQVALGAEVVLALQAAFGLLDPEDLDGSFEPWLLAVAPIVQGARSRSSGIAGAYLTALRAMEVGGGFAPVLAGPVDAAALATSMLVTGPASMRANLARAVPLERAREIAEGRSAAAGMRHALNGGRETITRSVRADERARGWRRVTSAKPCSFCVMLAGRGAVFREETVDFQSHDGCACGAEPLYR